MPQENVDSTSSSINEWLAIHDMCEHDVECLSRNW